MSAATRKTVSWPRKVFHLGMISSTGLAVSLAGLERGHALLVLAATALVVGGLDLLRLAVPRWNERVLRDFSCIMRDYEKHGVSSGFWFLVAALLLVAFAPLKLAGLACLYLAIGDPVASWVGVRYGKLRLPGGKSLEGSLALVFACFAVGTVFLGATGTVSWAAAPLVALGGALAAAVFEWLPVPLDDNFRVPIGSAAALAGLAAFFSPHVQV